MRKERTDNIALPVRGARLLSEMHLKNMIIIKLYRRGRASVYVHPNACYMTAVIAVVLIVLHLRFAFNIIF